MIHSWLQEENVGSIKRRTRLSKDFFMFCRDSKKVSPDTTKMVSKYDTHELKRKFIVVFGEAERFDNLWTNYMQYIKDLNSNSDYGEKYPISGFSVRDDLHSFANMKVGISRHDNNGDSVEVVHVMLNMK